MTIPAYGTPVRRLVSMGAGFWEHDYGRVVDHATTVVARSMKPRNESVLIQWWLPDSQQFGWTVRIAVEEIEVLPQYYEFVWGGS